jgi:hypothetical protein
LATEDGRKKEWKNERKKDRERERERLRKRDGLYFQNIVAPRWGDGVCVQNSTFDRPGLTQSTNTIQQKQTNANKRQKLKVKYYVTLSMCGISTFFNVVFEKRINVCVL